MPPQIPCREDGEDRTGAHYDRIAIVIRALSYLPTDEHQLPANGAVDRLPEEIREQLLSQIASKHAWDERSRVHQERSQLVQEFWNARREELTAARRSRHWKELERQVRGRAGGPVCERCGCRGGNRYDSARPPVELHHLTYDRLGNETLEDVFLLCSVCHAEEHRSGRAPQLSSLEVLELPEPA